MYSDYYIFNGNVYISENDFYFYQGKGYAPDEVKKEFSANADESKFILVNNWNSEDITNYLGNTSLSLFINENLIPTIKESGDQMSQISKKVDIVYVDRDIAAGLPASPCQSERCEVGERRAADATHTSGEDGLTPEKFIFFMSISDLFDSDNSLKREIDVKNDNLISNINLENCKNFWQLDFFKQ